MKILTQLFQVSIHAHPCYPLEQTTGNNFSNAVILVITKGRECGRQQSTVQMLLLQRCVLRKDGQNTRVHITRGRRWKLA